MVTTLDIRQAVQMLHLSDQPLCVHASLRSFGRVDGGGSALLEGLLLERCTVVVPTFTYFLEIAPHFFHSRWIGSKFQQ